MRNKNKRHRKYFNVLCEHYGKKFHHVEYAIARPDAASAKVCAISTFLAEFGYSPITVTITETK